jgi:DNA repair protein RecN (Recombination protein N)
MLRSLRIQNYALIDDLTIEFEPGLNVLTGETGAGKSIIIGALSLVLGDKTDPELIRTGKESALVDAVFEPEGAGPALRQLLEETALEPAGDEPLVLRRKLVRNGKGNCLVNDHPVNQTTLKRLGDLLVDLHGQHEHQSLLNRALHLDVLDGFAGLGTQRVQLAQRYQDDRATEQELTRIAGELKTRRERRDVTEFQYRELQTARLVPDELDALHAEKELLESAEKRLGLVRELSEIISEGERAVLDQLNGAARRLETLAQLDSRLNPADADLKQATFLLDELGRTIVKYRETIDAPPGRLDEVNERLFALERLVRKYSPVLPGADRQAIERLVARREELGQELASLEIDETRMRELEAQLGAQRTELVRRARQLSQARKKARARFEERLGQELTSLGMGRARIAVSIERQEDPEGRYEVEGRHYHLDARGIDDVEFLFTANPGEEVKPLRKIASGGELSRIMLALKGVVDPDSSRRVASESGVPVMVFDEIDVGIGGRIAETVGRKLAQIAHGRQVICITHLPQIAQFGETHFLVSKAVQSGRTLTRIAQLTAEERITEIARMLAGAEVTKTALAHAREMLGQKG